MSGHMYVVFNSQRNLLGYLHDKAMYELFKEQRNMENYIIHKVKRKENKLNKIITATHNDLGASDPHGVVMFPSEEEYHNEAFEQMISDFHQTVENFVTGNMPKIKFTKKEFETVRQFLTICYEAGERFWDEDGYPEENEIFDMPKLLYYIIDCMGG